MCRICSPGSVPYGPEDGVSAAGGECRVKGEVRHQMDCDILNTRAAAEINAHERADDLTVLIAKEPAS